MIGSKPTHLTLAFSHDEHAGRFWSHRFFRCLHLLHAETLRKEDEAEEWREGSNADGGEDFVAGSERFVFLTKDSCSSLAVDIKRTRFLPVGDAFIIVLGREMGQARELRSDQLFSVNQFSWSERKEGGSRYRHRISIPKSIDIELQSIELN